MTSARAEAGERSAPLIVTLELDAESFATFDTLRHTHFPPRLNLLSAHLTLFHHLPGHRREEIEFDLREVAVVDPPPLEVAGLRRLGRGVAYTLVSPTLDTIRAELARRWADDLTPQDRQPFRAHVTVQNKVVPDVAEALYARLSQDFTPWRATGEALALWRYLGGPWAAEARAAFGLAAPSGV